MKVCMKCGGKVKKAKMGTTVGKATPKGQMYGIPQTGPTGPNYQGVNTMKKGGKVTTLKKRGMGGMHMMPDGTMMKDSMMKKGGSTFGMLSVKAGVDKNPKPTIADRIAGAKMKMKIRKKK